MMLKLLDKSLVVLHVNFLCTYFSISNKQKRLQRLCMYLIHVNEQVSLCRLLKLDSPKLSDFPLDLCKNVIFLYACNVGGCVCIGGL